jgi:hypothetical protein
MRALLLVLACVLHHTQVLGIQKSNEPHNQAKYHALARFLLANPQVSRAARRNTDPVMQYYAMPRWGPGGYRLDEDEWMEGRFVPTLEGRFVPTGGGFGRDRFWDEEEYGPYRSRYGYGGYGRYGDYYDDEPYGYGGYGGYGRYGGYGDGYGYGGYGPYGGYGRFGGGYDW